MKHIVLIREEYTRDLEVYNRPNEPDTLEAGWEAACGPVYLGIYSGTEEEAIKAAAGDHGVVPQALVATPVDEEQIPDDLLDQCYYALGEYLSELEDDADYLLLDDELESNQEKRRQVSALMDRLWAIIKEAAPAASEEPDSGGELHHADSL